MLIIYLVYTRKRHVAANKQQGLFLQLEHLHGRLLILFDCFHKLWSIIDKSITKTAEMTFRLQRYEKKSKNPNKSRFFFVYRGDRPRDIGTVKWAPPSSTSTTKRAAGKPSSHGACPPVRSRRSHTKTNPYKPKESEQLHRCPDSFFLLFYNTYPLRPTPCPLRLCARG